MATTEVQIIEMVPGYVVTGWVAGGGPAVYDPPRTVDHRGDPVEGAGPTTWTVYFTDGSTFTGGYECFASVVTPVTIAGIRVVLTLTDGSERSYQVGDEIDE